MRVSRARQPILPAVAASASRFGLDTPPWSSDLRVSVRNPFDGSRRTLHDYTPSDLGVVEITTARPDPLNRFVYLRAALPPARYDFSAIPALFVLSFDASTGRLGTPTASGSSLVAAPQAFTPDGQFAYTADYDAGIHGFRVGADGRLSELPGSPFARGLRTSQPTTHPSGTWLFAPSVGTNTQDTAVFYRIDPVSGALTPVFAGVPVSELGFVVMQDASHVWWQHQRGQPYTLCAFDTVTGALAPAAPAVTIPDLGNSVGDMRISPGPADDLLVTERPVADAFESELQAWRLAPDRSSVAAIGAPLRIRYRDNDLVLRTDPVGGVQFAAVSPVAVAQQMADVQAPGQITDATFAIDAAARRLRVLAVDPASGALAQVDASVPLTGTPTALAVSPRLDFVAVASASSTGSGTLAVFRIDPATAALTPVASAATAASPTAASIAPAAPDRILVAHPGGIDSFRLGADGTLARVEGSPFVAGYGPSTFTRNADGSTASTEGTPLRDLVPTDLLVTANGDVFVGAREGDQAGVSTLYLQAATGPLGALHTGNFTCSPLTPRTGSTFTPTGSDTAALGVAGSSRWLYVVNRESATVSGFRVNEQPYCGLPDPWIPAMTDSPFGTPAQPVAIAVGQAGRFAYVAHAGNGGQVSAYAIDAGTGALVPLAGSPVGLAMVPARIWTDTFGRFVYTADAEGKVMVQTIDRATGLPGAPRLAALVPIANMGMDVVLSVH